jgi:trans-aconitate methyltransferase
MKNQYIAVYDSQTEKYHQAFHTFLEHTDQKINAKKRLDKLVKLLPQKRVLIDAGAGNGQITSSYSTGSPATNFDKIIGIEPNPLLVEELRQNCPSCEAIPKPISQAQPSELGDLVLCSHVFYYIERNEWLPTLQKLASWLSDDGLLVVILQSYHNDCMEMVAQFSGERYCLSKLIEDFLSQSGNKYQVSIEPVEAYINAPNLDCACIIAEFVINAISISTLPPWEQNLKQYIESKFYQPDGSYRFSCHQDFVLIQPNLAKVVPFVTESLGSIAANIFPSEPKN